ncbi:MAG: glycosyltransferase family 87 protein [Alicyclobacillaceae bacterium]|nr:glycosyltransferase family 87 protein [Alicyclobacillaceae bacterium]
MVALTTYSTVAEWSGMARMHLLHYDYAFFYRAFLAILHPASAGGSLYSRSAEQSFMLRHGFLLLPHNQYVYPPQFALLFSPLGLLSFSQSALAWLTLSVFCYVVGVFLFIRLLLPQLRGIRLFALWMVIAILTPAQIDLAAGNVNSILFGLVAMSLYLLYVRKRPLWAGLPLAVAIVFKVTPAAILVYVLLRRQWKMFFSTLTFTAVLSLLDIAVLGPQSLVYYARHFVAFGQTSMKNGPAPYNQSILGVLGMLTKHHVMLLSPRTETAIYMVFAATCGILILWLTQRTRQNQRWDVALASLTPLLFSPLIEEMHMMFALPAILATLAAALDTKTETTYLAHPAAKRRRQWSLRTLVTLEFLLLSLPTTFLLNFVTHRVPQLFFLHTQMFWVLLLATSTVMTQIRRPLATTSRESRWLGNSPHATEQERRAL